MLIETTSGELIYAREIIFTGQDFVTYVEYNMCQETLKIIDISRIEGD